MILSSSHSSSLFCAAIIASAHGLHGYVKVKSFLEDSSRLKAYSPFSNEKGEPVYRVKKILSQEKDILLVSFEGVTNRTEAEQLKGVKLMSDPSCLPTLSKDTYYHKDLIGLAVISQEEKKTMGTVHALYNFGAGDLLEITTRQRNLRMIPFTAEMIPEVNLEQGFLTLSEEGKTFLEGETA